jgi:hypothetical protein
VSVTQEKRPQVVNPSATSPWHGDPMPGSRWSRQQVATLRRLGFLNPEMVATVTVTIRLQNRTDWTMPGPTRDLLVPMLSKTRNGRRALIVAPAGDRIWKDVK